MRCGTFYTAGESFFEPPGSTHLISENASATKPAGLLAVFIADDGGQVTTFHRVGSAPPPKRTRDMDLYDMMTTTFASRDRR